MDNWQAIFGTRRNARKSRCPDQTRESDPRITSDREPDVTTRVLPLSHSISLSPCKPRLDGLLEVSAQVISAEKRMNLPPRTYLADLESLAWFREAVTADFWDRHWETGGCKDTRCAPAARAFSFGW